MNKNSSHTDAKAQSLKNRFFIILSSWQKPILLCLFSLFCFQNVFAQDFPERSNSLVTDYTSTLSPAEKQSLEQKLIAFNDSTSTQIAVVIMQSVGAYEIKDYATQLANKWGIGMKGKNNGALVLVALKDRKMTIQLGYGLEGPITDALSKRIIEKEMQPSFKQGNYYEGLDKATSTMMSLAKGEFTADTYLKQGGGEVTVPWLPLLLILGIIIFVLFSKVSNVSQYARKNNIAFWTAWAIMGTAVASNRGRWGDFSSGSGGFGGFGGGGSGGFGGFGGGSFGGGGSSGSW